MIIPQDIISNIQSTMTVRTMRLPETRGRLGELVVPARKGKRYGLQPAAFRPAQTYIVITDVYREPLVALTPQQAAREGHATVQAALDAYARCFGEPDETTLVWVVHFARDTKEQDVSTYIKSDDPVLLAATTGYTTSSSDAMRGEPEVLSFPKALEEARKKAQEKQLTPQQQAIQQQIQGIETCREAMTAMKHRGRVARALRELERVRDDLACECATLASSECVTRPASAAGKGDQWPRDAKSPVSLEPAA